MFAEGEGISIAIARPRGSWRLRAHAWAPGREVFREFADLKQVNTFIQDARTWAVHGRVEVEVKNPTLEQHPIWECNDRKSTRYELPDHIVDLILEDAPVDQPEPRAPYRRRR